MLHLSSDAESLAGRRNGSTGWTRKMVTRSENLQVITVDQEVWMTDDSRVLAILLMSTLFQDRWFTPLLFGN